MTLRFLLFALMLVPTSRGELSREMYGRSVCVSLPSPFIPTTKIPDWATYREMWVELRTAFCVTFPRTKE
jgi:hypothetical protein